MTKPSFDPVVRTQSDVEQMWRHLISPLGFSGHSIWMVVIEDDRPLRQVLEISESVEPPEGEDVAAFGRLLGRLASPGSRFAFLRSRPGVGGPDAVDRAWARVLYDACRAAGAAAEVVHLAHDQDILPIPLDDLLAEPA